MHVKRKFHTIWLLHTWDHDALGARRGFHYIQCRVGGKGGGQKLTGETDVTHTFRRIRAKHLRAEQEKDKATVR